MDLIRQMSRVVSRLPIYYIVSLGYPVEVQNEISRSRVSTGMQSVVYSGDSRWRRIVEKKLLLLIANSKTPRRNCLAVERQLAVTREEISIRAILYWGWYFSWVLVSKFWMSRLFISLSSLPADIRQFCNSVYSEYFDSLHFEAF